MERFPLPFETTYQQLPEVLFSRVVPDPVAEPGLAVFSAALAEELGLDLAGKDTEAMSAVFSGRTLLPGMQPIAQAYAGHQFGHFTMLGDGRAHLLGEWVTPTGRRVDIQLKGSGQTPYSRSGDGRAVLGPMLREYLISEAMAALGIPTTRALAVVTTGQPVQRETLLPGAILTRVAASHIRVGTFQFAAAHQNRSVLMSLLDYTIDRHVPEHRDAENKALALLETVIEKQADLIAHWMRVGFIHGVMNTDNMTLAGETIDYGPCAFMDTYDPQTVFSSIDAQGRYAYANQPAIALWNLTRLAESLLTLINDDEDAAIKQAEASLNRFSERYRDRWLSMMRDKLGLIGDIEGDGQLIADLLGWMKETQADYTNTFRDLITLAGGRGSRQAARDRELTGSAGTSPSQCESSADPTFSIWQKRWLTRLQQNNQPLESAHALMQRTNPAVIPRNHQVEAALAAATAGDMQPFHRLHAVLQQPYEDCEENAPYQDPPGPEACRYQTFCGT